MTTEGDGWGGEVMVVLVETLETALLLASSEVLVGGLLLTAVPVDVFEFLATSTDDGCLAPTPELTDTLFTLTWPSAALPGAVGAGAIAEGAYLSWICPASVLSN